MGEAVLVSRNGAEAHRRREPSGLGALPPTSREGHDLTAPSCFRQHMWQGGGKGNFAIYQTIYELHEANREHAYSRITIHGPDSLGLARPPTGSG